MFHYRQSFVMRHACVLGAAESYIQPEHFNLNRFTPHENYSTSDTMELTTTPQARVTVSKEADEILQHAINSFRTGLTPEQLGEFNSIQSLPDTNAVLVFTTELDMRRQSQRGKSIASRLFPVLQAVHSFTGVIETFVSSNPVIAALVWGTVKMTMQVRLLYTITASILTS